jgi:hypothetical protein
MSAWCAVPRVRVVLCGGRRARRPGRPRRCWVAGDWWGSGSVWSRAAVWVVMPPREPGRTASAWGGGWVRWVHGSSGGWGAVVADQDELALRLLARSLGHIWGTSRCKRVQIVPNAAIPPWPTLIPGIRCATRKPPESRGVSPVGPRGFEPRTSSLSGMRSNRAELWAPGAAILQVLRSVSAHPGRRADGSSCVT